MNTTARRAFGYFLELGFYPGQVELGGGLARKRLLWSIIAYALLFSGLLCKQCIDLRANPIVFSTANVRWNVLLASAVVALAIFPVFTHWFNRKRGHPSWEHVLWAFSFGFFVNLSSNEIWRRLIG